MTERLNTEEKQIMDEEQFLEENVQLVIFEVGNQRFGLEVSCIKEVIKVLPINVAPGSLEMIEGVIDLRGNIVPIIDLHTFMKLESIIPRDQCRILITEVDTYIFGLIVGKVYEVQTFPLSTFNPPPKNFYKDNEFIIGIGNSSTQLLYYLDVEKLLNIDSLLNPTFSIDSNQKF